MPAIRNDGGIVVHLEEILEQRGVSMSHLARAIGITAANMSILKTGKARAVRFSTLAAICEELQCQPGDLLTHERERGLSEGRAERSDRQ